MTLSGNPAISPTRSRSAGSNAISPRIARSVIAATFAPDAGISRELVEAFLADHGRIHVRHQEALVAMRGR